MRRVRKPYLMSCKNVSRLAKRQASWARSLVSVALPKCRRAARRASSGLMPFAIFSSVSRARLDSISSVRSSAMARGPVSMRESFDHYSRITLSFRLQHASHGFYESLPFGSCGHQLLAPQRRQAVILCSPCIGRGLPLGCNPAALHQPLHGGIERAVIHQELVLGEVFDKLADSLSVIRSHLQAAKDQDFEGSLQEFQSFR